MLYQVEQRGRQTAFVGEDGAGLVGLYPLLARASAIAENENSSFAAVSYTHLDVYKRQPHDRPQGAG